MSDTCNGECCAVFWLRKDMDLTGPFTEGSDAQKVADMVIPLTRRQALRRWRKFVSTERPLRKYSKTDTAYACKHWDEKTRLCGDYENRPDMCRNYPYGAACSHGCDYQIEDAGVAERYGNGTWKWDAEANGWRPKSSLWFLWDAENGLLKPIPKETPSA